MTRPEREVPAVAVAITTGVEYTLAGERKTVQVVGTDPGFVDRVKDHVLDEGKVVEEPITTQATQASRTRSHGMPGVKAWKATWEPRGPLNAPFKPKRQQGGPEGLPPTPQAK